MPDLDISYIQSRDLIFDYCFVNYAILIERAGRTQTHAWATAHQDGLTQPI